ncbi:aminotransferase class V-fold PLP-dependent enzyme [Corynebacterium sp. sy017]|uniref:aminotransferase class V-fold PLP-dependent enzyme n=1 Tax=unclassified Corynebacterium TaxID=2624378 RepID=UPI0011860CA8|nr:MULTISPECIES: aminotransferase class V-fold PLP-dependent enzyme [unclassified Corynebacterium]MBP3088348.1 aminotransferase class V-fold PLP-dependent enzyme [Corynebacterium sp. sy017]TSD91665.1 aminotransferase class V-fold PLP-dependent enzyme [Corynebacterium sp. SY003]
MSFDIAHARGLYTSLSDGWIYLNADSQPQVPETVAAAVSRSFRNARLMQTTAFDEQLSGTHAQAPALKFYGNEHINAARRALADLTGTQAQCVILGAQLPMLYTHLSQAIRPLMRRGAHLISSRADRNCIDPTIAGIGEVRYSEPDVGTAEVPAWQYKDLVSGSTRLVSLSAAHPHVGVLNPVAEISQIVHEQSRSWVLCDVTALVGAKPVSFQELGVDIIALDCAALGGPEIAALIFRDASMFPRIDTTALEFPISAGLAGGVAAIVDHIADLAGEQRGSRRNRLQSAVQETGAYLASLSRYLVDSLSVLPKVHLFGITGELARNAKTERIPRISFCMAGVPAHTIYKRLLSHGIITTMTGNDPLLNIMGAAETQGVISIGLSAFNTTNDIDQLLRALASLA